MTAPIVPDGDLAALEAGDTAAAAKSTSDLAASIAAKIAASTAGDLPAEPVVADTTPIVEPVVPVAEPAPVAEPVAAPEVTPVPDAVYTAEEQALTEQALNDLGIDLGVDPATLAPELQPGYQRVLKRVADFAEDTLNQQLEASDAIHRVNDFRTRLEESPDTILLALAVNKPQVFAEAVELYQAMQSDENVKKQVMDRLEVEAQRADLGRREAQLVERDRTTQARRVTVATRRAAAKYSIPYAAAEKLVAAMVTANGGNLEVSAVDGIIAPLAAQPKPVRVATPAAVAAAATAPTAPVTPVAPAAGPEAGAAPALNPKHGGGVFGSLVRNAAQRLASTE